MKVFLAHSFRPDDRHLVADIERLLASHDVRVSTGRVLGGGALTEQVMRRIDSAVALVAVMTRGEQIANAAATWRTHPWVEDELVYGRAKGKRAICLVESGVALGGAAAMSESSSTEALRSMLSLRSRK